MAETTNSKKTNLKIEILCNLIFTLLRYYEELSTFEASQLRERKKPPSWWPICLKPNCVLTYSSREGIIDQRFR